MIEFQQSQILTSHFEIFWSIVFWRENSNVVEITKETLTFEKNLPLLVGATVSSSVGNW